MKENCLCIRNYINTDRNSPDYEAERRNLASEITDPAVLDRSSLLPDDSPLKIESQIITDAFEAVTNGMENPGVIEALEKIPEDSVLVSWKYITLAVKAFYDGDYGRMTEILSSVEEFSPAKKLERVLLHLSGIKELEDPSKKELKLIKSIRQDRSLFSDARDQIKSALEDESEELFTETVLLIVREMKSRFPEEAERLAVWSIRTASEREFSQTLFLKGYKLIFGNTEGLRLFALALDKTEPDIAVLFWIQSFISRLKSGDTPKAEAAAYLKIISMKIDSSVSGGFIDSEEKEFMTGLFNLAEKLRQDISVYFPSVNLPDGRTDDPFMIIRQLEDAFTEDSEDKTEDRKETAAAARGAAVQPEMRKEPLQLSLF